MLAALTAMAQGRPALAGLLIALLTLKPQLGLLIPIALVFSGQWRVVLWATIAMLIVYQEAVFGTGGLARLFSSALGS